MRFTPFTLERYFARYEFSARYLLSSSDCDGLPLAEVLGWADDETRALWDGLELGYTESAGHPLLLKEIAGLYDGVQAGEIVEFVPEEGIYAAMHCLLQAGDHVVSAFPAYQSLFQFAEDLGCEVDHWKPREAEGWRFDPGDLEKLVRPTTRLIVVNFPHNPTGYLPSLQDFERVVDTARGCGAYLFCDEMYRFLEQDPALRLPSGVDLYDKAVVLFGMSKTFGLAGLRLGWLATHDEALREHLQSFKDWLTICGSAPSELLALIALRKRHAIVDRHVQRIRRNMGVLQDFAGAHPGLFDLTAPRAGSICLSRLLAEPSAMAFAERVVQEAGIMIVPSPVFGYGDNHIRIGLGRENFPAALAKLADYLDGR